MNNAPSAPHIEPNDSKLWMGSFDPLTSAYNPPSIDQRQPVVSRRANGCEFDDRLGDPSYTI
jgi:hypothetical protein